jgi:hypothetical protein
MSISVWECFFVLIGKQSLVQEYEVDNKNPEVDSKTGKLIVKTRKLIVKSKKLIIKSIE